ncbi:MAG: cellulose binding domain-containing protein [Micromonosporaceae bacterium]|nr:cellulose binding domain-containing protein [Micromonosporaceae bacterium]
MVALPVSAWNAQISGTTSETAVNMPYNGTIQPGQSTHFGFQASYSGTNTTRRYRHPVVEVCCRGTRQRPPATRASASPDNMPGVGERLGTNPAPTGNG